MDPADPAPRAPTQPEVFEALVLRSVLDAAVHAEAGAPASLELRLQAQSGSGLEVGSGAPAFLSAKGLLRSPVRLHAWSVDQNRYCRYCLTQVIRNPGNQGAL